MGKTIEIKVEGVESVIKALKQVGIEFTGREAGEILRAGGREVARAAKKKVPFKGEVGRKLKKDIVTSRIKGGKANPYVLIGPAFREKIGNQKVAVIAQHMTEGFNQKSRVTGSKGSRGIVKDQLENAILRGFDASESQRNSAMNKEVRRKIKKVAYGNPNVRIL